MGFLIIPSFLYSDKFIIEDFFISVENLRQLVGKESETIKKTHLILQPKQSYHLTPLSLSGHM
jgi:hypothetical protein